jgi:hypothetical protein
MPPIQGQQSHGVANLIQGIIGLGLTCFVPFGALIGVPLMMDAGLDYFTGRGAWGWACGLFGMGNPNTRSLASSLVEPRSPGVSARQPYVAPQYQ